MKRIGIECESIEGRNPMWGVGRIIIKLLEEISLRPELEKDYRFVLYFKDRVPDFDFLKAPLFETKIVPVPFFKNRLFPIYYFALLPMRLWFDRPDIMFWPNYMLPIIAFGRSLVVLTEDVYYETHKGTLPFRYRLAYGIFGWWTAKFATKIMAISETSKKNLTKLYSIQPKRIVMNYLGVDVSSSFATSFATSFAKASKVKKASKVQKATEEPRQKEDNYLLFVGQMFPRRHAKETIMAFAKLLTEHSNILQNIGISKLRLIAIGPDKYEVPTIDSLVFKTNEQLGQEAIIHKDYVSNEELTQLYSGAKAFIYVSDREAFGLPPMEALSFGVPPIIADNELSRELFRSEYAFYVGDPSPEGIVEGICNALTQTAKILKIKNDGPAFARQYTWSSFTNRWLEIIRLFIC